MFCHGTSHAYLRYTVGNMRKSVFFNCMGASAGLSEQFGMKYVTGIGPVTTPTCSFPRAISFAST